MQGRRCRREAAGTRQPVIPMVGFPLIGGQTARKGGHLHAYRFERKYRTLKMETGRDQQWISEAVPVAHDFGQQRVFISVAAMPLQQDVRWRNAQIDQKALGQLSDRGAWAKTLPPETMMGTPMRR